MRVVGIDPGPETSGFVLLEEKGDWLKVLSSNCAVSTDDIVLYLAGCGAKVACVEWVTFYGRMVGASVFDTARVAGYWQAIAERKGMDVEFITRPDVALELCGTKRAKDGQVHAELSRLFETKAWKGGGKIPARGTKKQPGPLYGIRSHAWDALAVAVAWYVGR